MYNKDEIQGTYIGHCHFCNRQYDSYSCPCSNGVVESQFSESLERYPLKKEFLPLAKEILQEDYPVFEKMTQQGYFNLSEPYNESIIPGAWHSWCNLLRRSHIRVDATRICLELAPEGRTDGPHRRSHLEALGWSNDFGGTLKWSRNHQDGDPPFEETIQKALVIAGLSLPQPPKGTMNVEVWDSGNLINTLKLPEAFAYGLREGDTFDLSDTEGSVVLKHKHFKASTTEGPWQMKDGIPRPSDSIPVTTGVFEVVPTTASSPTKKQPAPDLGARGQDGDDAYDAEAYGVPLSPPHLPTKAVWSSCGGDKGNKVRPVKGQEMCFAQSVDEPQPEQRLLELRSAGVRLANRPLRCDTRLWKTPHGEIVYCWTGLKGAGIFNKALGIGPTKRQLAVEARDGILEVVTVTCFESLTLHQ